MGKHLKGIPSVSRNRPKTRYIIKFGEEKESLASFGYSLRSPDYIFIEGRFRQKGQFYRFKEWVQKREGLLIINLLKHKVILYIEINTFKEFYDQNSDDNIKYRLSAKPNMFRVSFAENYSAYFYGEFIL